MRGPTDVPRSVLPSRTLAGPGEEEGDIVLSPARHPPSASLIFVILGLFWCSLW